MKLFKKIFLTGLIFSVILLLQIFFSEKNFAANEDIADFSVVNCQNDIANEMQKISSENKIAYNKNIKKIWTSLVRKSEILSYNFRILVCNYDSICSWLQDYMFMWEDWRKKWNDSWNVAKIDSKKVDLSSLKNNTVCPTSNFNRNIFKSCGTSNTISVNNLNRFCKNKKDVLLFWKDWKSWIYKQLVDNFENDAKTDKVNFLAARIYSINEKMRDLANNMSELKINIVNIVDRLVCTVK